MEFTYNGHCLMLTIRGLCRATCSACSLSLSSLAMPYSVPLSVVVNALFNQSTSYYSNCSTSLGC